MSSLRARILIADDHLLVAEVCKQLLEPEFAVVGIVENGADLVIKAMEVRPDVILVDITMPVLNGLSAASQVKLLLPNVKVVYLTMHSDPQIAMEAFDKGASAYVLKTCAASELARAVRTVLTGRRCLPSNLREIIERLRWERVKPIAEADRLTTRQREVLQLLAQGKNMQEIGDSLEVTSRTVAFHKYRMRAALGAKSDAELIQYAVRNGVLAA
jgi:DNA-binding NarL/FixJ family response regulator